MNTLVEWIGKTEDIQIMYDAGIAKNSLLLAANDGITANFPAIIYPFPDNIREVEAVSWEESVSKADRLWRDCRTDRHLLCRRFLPGQCEKLGF